MLEIFPGRGSCRPGLVLFLNAGDPSFEELRRLVLLLDEQGVDCLELAVPFPNSITDGPVIRRSARRAIDSGADLARTLAFVEAVRPELLHLKIVLMADWRYTVRALDLGGFLGSVADAGCDGLLLHGVPPRARPGYYDSARLVGLPIVTTCYASSQEHVMEEAALNASAYVYLVSHYGKGEGAGPPDAAGLVPAIELLREMTTAPVAVGFGIRTGEDVRRVWETGADAAIVGSACVASVERALAEGRDLMAAMRGLVRGLQEPLPVS